MAQYDGSIRINTQINTKGLRQGEGEIRSSIERMSSVMKKFAGVIATAFAVGKMVQFGKEATRLGSDLQEVENVVAVAFPNMTKAMDEFAKSARTNFGLSESMAKRYSSLFGTMAKQFNFTEKEAFEMGTTLAGLAGDVASFYDISQDLAYIKLKSVFSGETETLKDIGVVMTEAALNQYALANGINKTISKMTEQEKVALRYQFVLEQLSQASGDFVRTSSSWANQTRMLKLQFDSLRATIGQGLINVFTPVIKAINILLGKLATVASAFKSFTELLTGNKASSGGGSGIASAGLGDMADGYNEASGAAENLADSTEKVAEATKDAQKAAEGYLSPLDEINKFKDESSSGVGSGGAGPSATAGVGGAIGSVDYGNLAEGETIVDKFSKKLLELKEILSGIIRPFKDAWESEGESTIEAAHFAFSSLGELVRSVAKSFYEVWTNGTGTQTLELILQIAQNVLITIGNIAQRLNEAWNINDIGTSIIQNIFNIYNTILSTIERITGATAEWAKTLDFTPLLTSINGLLESIHPLTKNIGAGLAWFYENVLLPLAGFTIEEVIPRFLDTLSNALKIVNGILDGLKPLFQWFWDEVLQPIAQWTGGVFLSAWDTIIGVLDRFGDWLSKHQGVVQGFAITLGALFSASMVAKILSAAISLGEYIVNAGGLVAVLQTLTASLLSNTAAWFSNTAAKIADKAETLAIIGLYAKDFIVNLASSTAALAKQAAQFAINTAAKIADAAAQMAMTAATVAWNAVCALATAATTAFGAAVAFLTSPIGIAIAAIGAIIAIGVLLYKNWDTVKEKAGELKDWLVKNWEDIKQKTSDIWDAIKTKISDVWDAIKTVVSNAINAVKTTVSNIWNAIKTTTSNVWNGIKSAISGVWNGIKSTASSVFNGIKTVISTIWNALNSVSSSVWNSIKSAISGIWNGIKSMASNTFGGIKDTIVNIWENLKSTTSRVWEGIVRVIKAPINAIIDIMNGLLRGMASAVNGIANMLNSLSFDIPDWLGGGSFHLNIPTWTPGRIPRLATGTVVPPNREFMAVLGDNKREPEIVSPLSTMKQANREALLEVLSELGLTGGGIGNNQPIIIKWVADGKQLTELVIKNGKVQQMSTGRNPFMLGTT